MLSPKHWPGWDVVTRNTAVSVKLVALTFPCGERWLDASEGSRGLRGKPHRACVRNGPWLLTFPAQTMLCFCFGLQPASPCTAFCGSGFLFTTLETQGNSEKLAFPEAFHRHTHSPSTRKSGLSTASPRLLEVTLRFLWFGLRSESGFWEQQRQV